MDDLNQGERNVIFLHPITSNLKDLKDDLEKDPAYSVFEVDSLPELVQLIGATPGAITFCSDLSKAQKVFEAHDKLIKKFHTKFILCSEKKVSPIEFIHLQKKGLYEQIAPQLTAKALNYKINLLFKAQESKNKAAQNKINNKEKLRVEKGIAAEVDQTREPHTHQGPTVIDAKGSMQDFSKYGENLHTFAQDTKNHKITDEIQQIDQNYKSKKATLTPFLPLEADQKVKKIKNPFALAPLPENKKRKQLEELSQLQQSPSDDAAIDDNGPNKKNDHSQVLDNYWDNKKKDHKNFEEIEEELQLNNKNSLKDIEADPNKKEHDFIDQSEELKLKKLKSLKDVSGPKKKDQTQIHDPGHEKNLPDHKNLKEEIIQSQKIEKNELDHSAHDLKKKKSLQDLIDEEMKLAQLEEINKPNDGLKKATHFEENEEQAKKLKGLDADFAHDPEEKKTTTNDQWEIGKKNHGDLDFDPNEVKKIKSFEELDREEAAKLKKLDLNHTAEQKKSSLNIVETFNGPKPKKLAELAEQEKNRRHFQEEKLSSYWGEKNQKKEEVIAREKKIIEDVEIDYSWAKKDKKTGKKIIPKLPDDMALYKIEEQLIDEELESYEYYPPDDLFAIYSVYATSFIYMNADNAEKMAQFIQFVFKKSYRGVVSFYRYNSTQSTSFPTEIFSGHALYQDFVDQIFEESWVSVIDQWWQQWAAIKTPWWSDQTWQDKIQTFIFPYYHQNGQLGFAVANFQESIKNEQDSKNIELLISTMRSYYLKGQLR